MNEKDIPQTKATGKKVLLFSGGLDSLLMAHLLHDERLLLLRVRIGASYEKEEDTAIEALQAQNFLPAELVTIDMPFLSGHERLDKIVPLRNLFFTAAGALYGEDVMLGAVYGDTMLLDKSPAFLDQMTGVLSYLFGPQRWCEGKVVQVSAPYIETTKTELVSRFMALNPHIPGREEWTRFRDSQEKLLFTSFSCHTPHFDGVNPAQPCGHCKPCVRKWTALRLNGIIHSDIYFAKSPWTAPWIHDKAPLINAGKYRGPKEDMELIRAMAMVGAAVR